MDGEKRYFSMALGKIEKSLRQLAWSSLFSKPINLLGELLEVMVDTYWKLNAELSSACIAGSPQFDLLMTAFFPGSLGN